MHVLIAQLGARRHYAIPQILETAGILDRLYTDAYGDVFPFATLGWFPPFLLPSFLRRLAGRTAELSKDKIVPFQKFGVQYAYKLRKATSPTQATRAHLWAGTTFNRFVLGKGLGTADVIYGFGSASRELFAAAKRRGLMTVLDQTIAPKLVELRLLQEEREAAEGWEPPTRDELAGVYAVREKEEWALSDVILCGSDFVQTSVIEEGGSSEKCIVVPTGVELNRFAGTKARGRRNGLNVLFVGGVSLRKGIRHLCEALRHLSSTGIRCRIVGPIHVDETRFQEAVPSNVEIVGSVPREEIFKYYTWADVFCLPSLCEGSALVIYEALAAGLPVITTPNAGSIVRDGVEGYVVSASNAEAIAAALKGLASDREQLNAMSKAARERAAFGSLEAYGKRLIHALSQAFTNHRS